MNRKSEPTRKMKYTIFSVTVDFRSALASKYVVKSIDGIDKRESETN
jgi:hypothetical protein